MTTMDEILKVFENSEIIKTKEELKMTVFQNLKSVDVSGFTEKKNNLSYLSWAWAWANVIERYPESNYEIKKNEDGLPYFSDDSGAMVYTSVTIEGITREMWLPVMDGANKAMKKEDYTYKVANWVWKNGKKTKDGFIDKSVESYTMFDINKTVMRCLVKNLAMFGLGLNVYAGEDLPLEITEDDKPAVDKVSEAQVNLIKKLFKDKKITVAQQNKTLKDTYKVSSLDQLSKKDASAIIKKLQG